MNDTQSDVIKVLIIDENEAYASTIRRLLLEQHGNFEVETAYTLTKATKLLYEESYDCILTEIVFPDAMELPVVEVLHEITPKTPIIVLTNLNDKELIAKCLQEGAQDYLIKDHISDTVPARVILSSIGRIRSKNRKREYEKNKEPSLEKTTIGIIVTDMEGVINSWDRMTEEILELGHDDLHQKSLPSMLTSEIWQRIKEQDSERFVKRKLLQTLFKKRNGEQIKLNIYTSGFGDKAGLIHVIQEASNQKTTEYLQLVRASRMEAAGLLALGVAHEVKNPLMAIIMRLQFLEVHLKDADPDTKEALAEISSSAWTADRAVKGLLNFATTTELKLEKHSIDKMLDQALKLAKHTFYRYKVDVVKKYKSDLPPINLDASKMEQVFVNVFLNAAHAMDNGGVLTVDVEVKSNHDKVEELIIRIDDTGCGMTEDTIKHIFEPFYTTKSKSQQGNGLGVTVCKKIIETHNGDFNIENLPEKGARVTIILRNDE